MDRLVNQRCLLVPGAGAPVQIGHGRSRKVPLQPLPQDVRKEMMIAIPLAPVVQGDEKKVGLLYLL